MRLLQGLAEDQLLRLRLVRLESRLLLVVRREGSRLHLRLEAIPSNRHRRLRNLIVLLPFCSLAHDTSVLSDLRRNRIRKLCTFQRVSVRSESKESSEAHESQSKTAGCTESFDVPEACAVGNGKLQDGSGRECRSLNLRTSLSWNRKAPPKVRSKGPRVRSDSIRCILS